MRESAKMPIAPAPPQPTGTLPDAAPRNWVDRLAPAAWQPYLQLMRLDRPNTPTLIIHGSEDRCTPLGQAQELYAGLVERGVESELVVYPHEGHGLREDAHRRDYWRRAVAWFDRHLRQG